MKSLFSLDNPFMQFLSRVADMIILNAMTLLCSLPIITAGAALSALHRVCQDIAFEAEGGIVKPYFRAFRQNFKQATIVWLMEVVVLAALICDLLLVMAYFGDSVLMYVVLAVLALVMLGVLSYLIPLVTRYTNSMRQHLINAISLALIKLPKTLILVVLNLLPVLLLLISPQVFVQTLVFWVIIGVAFVAYIQEVLLRSVFEQLEKGNQSVTLGM